MSEIWLQEYIFLAFRLHKVVKDSYGSPFVEEYWGPSVWREQIETEPEISAAFDRTMDTFAIGSRRLACLKKV